MSKVHQSDGGQNERVGRRNNVGFTSTEKGSVGRGQSVGKKVVLSTDSD